MKELWRFIAGTTPLEKSDRKQKRPESAGKYSYCKIQRKASSVTRSHTVAEMPGDKRTKI